MELEPPPAKKLKSDENGEALSVDTNGAFAVEINGAEGVAKLETNGAGVDLKTNGAGEEKKPAQKPLKIGGSASQMAIGGAAVKSESKTSFKEEVVDVRSRSCPYLDTINRHFLDFDFEKLCSVSLSHLNFHTLPQIDGR